MKRLVSIVLFTCISISLLAGELGLSAKKIGENRPIGKRWYIEFAAGYGFKVPRTQLRSPLEKEIGTVDYYEEARELSIKPIFSSNGGGPEVNVGFGHMFNKYIGIGMNVFVGFHPKQLDARTRTDRYFAEQYTHITAAYIVPHVRFSWDNGGRVGIFSKIGIFTPIGGSVTSDAVVDDREGRLLATFFALELFGLPLESIPFVETSLVARGKTTLNPSAGLMGSLGMDVKLTDRTTVFLEVAGGFYTIRPKETKFEKFEMKNKILGLEFPDLNFNVDNAPAILTHYIYRNEITEESNNPKYNRRIDINKPLDLPAMINNGSTLYINAGFRFDMNRWDKRGPKVEAKVLKKQEKKAGKKGDIPVEVGSPGTELEFAL